MKHFLLALLATTSLAAFAALPAAATDSSDNPDAAKAEKAAAADKADDGAPSDSSSDVPAEKAKAKAEAKADAAAEVKAAKAEGKHAKDFTVLKLDGEEIKNSEAEEMWKGLFPGGSAPDFNSFDENIRQNVLRGIVSERLLYQEAVKDGFDKSDEVQKRLESLKKQLVIQTFIEHKAKKLITEQQLKTAYAEHLSKLKHQDEIRARHILVNTEEEAKGVQKDLKKGGDFEKIAKDKSIDKGSGAQGGELGWFTKDKMVPEFAEAAFKLKKGETSEPVKTSFGWHIIQVEDRRPIKVPTFEDMRDELQSEVSNKAVQDYVEGLLKKADIKYYGPDGKEREFSRSLQSKK